MTLAATCICDRPIPLGNGECMKCGKPLEPPVVYRGGRGSQPRPT